MVDSGHQTTLKSLFWGVAGYNPAMSKHYRSILAYSISDEAKFRLEVINHFNQFGLASTKQAYKVSKPTVYRWRGILKRSEGKASSLIPKKKTPTHQRQMNTDVRIVGFIRDQRQKHYRLGKRKIKPELDRYCQSNHLKPISLTTIAKIINRNHFFFQKQGRNYHNPNSKVATRKVTYKTRVKRSPAVLTSGYIEIDTIALFVDGLKRYVYHALDVQNKFDFAYTYTRLNSQNTVDFIKKLEMVYPLITGIKIVQNDNGLEFHGDFESYLQQRRIKQLFIYPRCPKINGFIERSNRSLKEEFIYANLGLLVSNLAEFNQELILHLLWYNTTRPHEALNDMTPINYLLKRYPESQMYTTCTRT
jgi:transposase InsO family protein